MSQESTRKGKETSIVRHRRHYVISLVDFCSKSFFFSLIRKNFFIFREQMANSLLKSQDSALSQQSIPKVIVRAEPTLPRLLRTLDTDPIKMVRTWIILHFLNGRCTFRTFMPKIVFLRVRRFCTFVVLGATAYKLDVGTVCLLFSSFNVKS